MRRITHAPSRSQLLAAYNQLQSKSQLNEKKLSSTHIGVDLTLVLVKF